jgi:hypothetical protein
VRKVRGKAVTEVEAGGRQFAAEQSLAYRDARLRKKVRVARAGGLQCVAMKGEGSELGGRTA